MFTIEPLSAADFAFYRAHLVALLTDVVNGGSSVGFIAPLAPSIAHGFWDKISTEVQNNSRMVLAAIEGDHNQREIVGCVHLALAMPLNGTHRAEIQKLLVHSRHRQKGVGTGLIMAAETAARTLGKSLLTLDTEADSTADSLYQRWGFVRSGMIPRYALNSDGTKLIDTVIYYKLI